MTTSLLLQSVLDYAAVGWHVFPVHHPTTTGCSCRKQCSSPYKHPRTRNGLDDATTDPGTIRRWWERGPESNIGIVTGKRSGLVVLDVDGAEGSENWDRLEEQHGTTPSSFLVTTPRDGVHVYFAHPGRTVPNSAGKLAPNIDVRADGGYVVAHPSNSANGRGWRQWTGKGCEGWVDGTARLARMPEWVSPRQVERPSRRAVVLRRPGGSRYANTALDAECGRVALAPVGQRNDTLNRAAFNLGTLIGAGEIGRETVVERLLDAAHRAGLGDDEAEATLASGLGKGMANPRKRAS